MNQTQSKRLVQKKFICNRCKDLQSQLVSPFSFSCECKSCGGICKEIDERKYKELKKKKEPVKVNYNGPTLDNPSNVYQRPPTRHNQNEENQMRQSRYRNIENNMRNNRPPSGHRASNQRGNSTNHVRDNNFMNNFNIIHNNIGSIFNNIFNRNEREERQSNNRRYTNENTNQYANNNQYNDNQYNNHRHSNQRGRSTNHRIHPMNNFFSDFFNGFGINFDIVPIRINSHNNFDGFMNVFDPIFISFGSNLDNVFQNNFSSNFRSNLNSSMFSRLMDILRQNFAEAEQNRHPPTSKEALNKLKKFAMNSKYCKKNEKGKMEQPNCCICMCEITNGEETMLLPCGHMFHWKCSYQWLKDNNTCPVCRFELPAEGR